MTDEKFDQLMRQALSPESVPESLLRRTMRKMEERTMRRVVGKNRILAVLACCLLLATIAVGAAQFIRRGTVSQSINKEFKKYEQLGHVQMELGYRCNVPEQLPGNYNFQSMSITHETALGDHDAPLREYKSLMVVYQNDLGSEIYLNTVKKADEDYGRENPEIIRGNAGTIHGIGINMGTPPAGDDLTEGRTFPAEFG